MTRAPSVYRKLSTGNERHGMYGTPTYISWCGMISRCENVNDPFYRRYGARGVIVCERWRNSFMAFHEDMGDRPDGMTLDRFPDVNGPYCKSNCRWASAKEQGRNRDTVRDLTVNGRTQCLTAWAEEVGLHPATLHTRLRKGMSPEEAVTTPLMRTPLVIEFRGRTQSLREWAKEIGIAHTTLKTRLDEGWSVEEALTLPLQFSWRKTQIAFGGITDSVVGWADRVGLKRTTLRERLRRGWTVEDALTTPTHGDKCQPSRELREAVP